MKNEITTDSQKNFNIDTKMKNQTSVKNNSFTFKKLSRPKN